MNTTWAFEFPIPRQTPCTTALQAVEFPRMPIATSACTVTRTKIPLPLITTITAGWLRELRRYG